MEYKRHSCVVHKFFILYFERLQEKHIINVGGKKIAVKRRLKNPCMLFTEISLHKNRSLSHVMKGKERQ